MNTQKWLIISSFLIIVIMFLFAALLEWNIINNTHNISFFIGHREFVINLILGIGASAIVSFVISLVSYKREKRNIIKKYFQVLSDIYVEVEFFVHAINEYKGKNGLVIPDGEMEYFTGKIINMRNLLRETLFIGVDYSPIILFWKEDCLNLYQNRFHRVCNDRYGDLLILCEFTNKEHKLVLNELERIAKDIGNGSEFEEYRRAFDDEIVKYLNLKEPNI